MNIITIVTYIYIYIYNLYILVCRHMYSLKYLRRLIFFEGSVRYTTEPTILPTY